MIKAIVFAAALVGLSAAAQAQVELNNLRRQGRLYRRAEADLCVNSPTRSRKTRTTSRSGTAAGTTVWRKKHAMKVDRAKTLEHEVIVYCKANQDKKVIQAIDVVFKKYRAEKGIKTN